MKPVHRESNLDVDYVISYKISSDGRYLPAGELGKAKLTPRRSNESSCPIQKADPLSGRRGFADRSAKWQRQLPSGLRESSG
jgi:hypothetical protein